jgi:hypothetical protein
VVLTRGRDGARDERGAVLVLIAIMMLLLLSFAALAIDFGVARAYKRQVQNGADAGAFGGVQNLVPGFNGQSPSLTSAETTARALEADNIADYSANTTSCVDPNALPNTNGTNDCVSFDTSFSRIRVVTPPQSVATLLGGALGFGSLETRAGAEATYVQLGFGNVAPLVIGNSATYAPELCLWMDSGLLPCSSSDNDVRLGFHDLRTYGNVALQTTRRCGSTGTDQQARARTNLAIGADHAFTISGSSVSDSGCNAFPNSTTALGSLGNSGPQTAITDGLMRVAPGSSSVDDLGGARLRRGGFPTATFLTFSIDNKPLYEFIPSGNLADAPDSCERGGFDSIVTGPGTAAQKRDAVHLRMQHCFFEYKCGRVDTATVATSYAEGDCGSSRAGSTLSSGQCGGNECTGVVFGLNTDPLGAEGDVDLYDIQLAPRFGYVLQRNSTNATSSGSVNAFGAVYIYRLDAACNTSTPVTCSNIFEPGPWNSGGNGSNQTLDAFTAFVFSPLNPTGGTTGPTINMLPPELRPPASGGALNDSAPYRVGSTIDVRLWK